MRKNPNIRLATAADVPSILKMGREFAEEFLSVPFTADSARKTVLALMGGSGCVIVADNGCRPVGMIGLIVYPLYMSSGCKVASELFWWVEPDYRKGPAGIDLLEAAEAWALENGCNKINMIALEASHPEVVGRLYKRRGYIPVEHSYSKELR